MATRVSMEGLVEIASHEGIVNAPYLDSVGVWTVGIGHTASAGPPNPATKRGEYSMTELMDIFASDIRQFEKGVLRAFTRPLKQHEFDAAVSFNFNTGAIERATWVKKWNAGDIAGARKSFMDWRKPAEIVPRREKERDLFFDGKYSNNGSVTMWPANTAGQVLWSRGKRVKIRELMNRENAPDAPIPTPKPVDDDPKPSPSPAPTGNAGKVAAGSLVAAILAAMAMAWEKVSGWVQSLF